MVEEVDCVAGQPARAASTDADVRPTSARRSSASATISKASSPRSPPRSVAGEPGGALYEAVIDALKEIYDPEIPVNIYDLGLIYGVEVDRGATRSSR